jgi:uncharacterized protein YajQ (UPF0234 family)
LINVSDTYKLGALLDALESKMVKRNLSLKILDKSKPEEEASGGRIRKHIPFKKGLTSEQAKTITKKIREVYPKAKASIQGESIRVSSASKDELQGIMNLLRTSDLDLPIQFTNFK